MAHKIIDNFLDPQDFLEIKSIFESGDVPWYIDRVVTEESTNDTDYNFQFVHSLYAKHQPQHSGLNYISKILQKITPISIYRIKINLRPRADKINDDYFHLDRQDLVKNNIHYTIGIFYLNNNNGYTLLENGTKIKSIENRMLLMSGDTRHSGTTSTDANRLLINFNFLNEETSELYNTK